MNPKRLVKALLFPHPAIMILLVPTATVLLVGSMVLIGTKSVMSYISYVVAAYTLTVWCLKLPSFVHCIKTFKNNNKYTRIWQDSPRLRVNVSLYTSLAWNALYGFFHLCLGFYHRTFWFFSLGAYYICLGAMRFFLVRHTKKYAPGERLQAELVKYRACGWVFLLMNLTLSLITFFMVYWNRTFEHHMITAITMAAYTFTALTTAIVNVVKYRKYNSPVFSASKAIRLAAALVSMLTLESTMLTTFNRGTVTPLEQKWLLSATGGAISACMILMAIYMIIVSTRKLNSLKSEVKNGEQ